MPDTLPNEINRMAYSMEATHGSVVSSLAALLYVSECVFLNYGEQYGAQLAPLLGIQRRCVDAYAVAEGVAPSVVDKALGDLLRANSTLDYLSSIPN